MFYKKFVDNKNDVSVANRLRRQMFQIFLDRIGGFDRPIQVLDIGGRPGFWEMRHWFLNGIYKLKTLLGYGLQGK